MSIYESKSIKEFLSWVADEKIVIPAMQRNFVWPEYKITALFDSLMRDYPIGTFLLWNVTPAMFNEYSFSKVVSDYKENREKFYRGGKAKGDRTEYIAVLDGQQRLTSLCISLIGTYKTHIKNKPWEKEDSYEKKNLCLNILYSPTELDDEYDFAFVPEGIEGELQAIADEDGKTTQQFWVKVSDIMNLDGVFTRGTVYDFINDLEDLYPEVFDKTCRRNAHDMLQRLNEALARKLNINYYAASAEMTIPQIIDIFVRVNSGGQKLDDADLILSIASGDNADGSFFDTIENAIEDIRAATLNTFPCDKKFLLSACLFFADAESLSLKRPENYSRDSITKIQKILDSVKTSIINALDFIEKLSFDVSKLSSNNLVIPIAYYFYLTKRKKKYFDKKTKECKCDRAFIRQWMLRTMMNGVFAEGTGSTLIRIRKLLKDEFNAGKRYFPLDALIEERIKKPLTISEDHIHEILGWKYGDRRIQPILMEISPEMPYDKYSVDHIWPQTIMKSAEKLKEQLPKASDSTRREFKSRADLLANLQLMTKTENSHKNGGVFKTWVEQDYPSKKSTYYSRNLIPLDVEYDFDRFLDFYDKRVELITTAIKVAFPNSFDEIKKRYNIG